uniref:Uncharacterized protein n=1 Tax=Solanum lycopersicum TaxID=4081 RepID=K4BWF2_SOLLC
MRCIYEPKGINLPDPIESICTKWGSGPFLFGSYSHVYVQSSGSDYDILTENLGATMHGDYLSGIRETSHISQFIKARKIFKGKLYQSMLDKEIIIGRIVQNPDLAFAKFLFVFDPLTCDSKSLGLSESYFWKTLNLIHKR